MAIAGFFQRADVSLWDDIDTLVARTVERFGRLDIMVNNAAIFSGTALLDTTPAQWDSVMAVNMPACSMAASARSPRC